MHKSRILIFTAAVAALSATSASAVSAQDRTGFYVDIGANFTIPSNQLTASGSSLTDTKPGAAFTLGAGAGLNGQWRLGGQIDYFEMSDVFENDIGPGVDGEVTMYSVAAAFYPSVKNDVWIKANLGYAQDKLSGGGSATASGFAGGLGVGYDWLIGRGGFVVAPYLSYLDLFSTGDFGGPLAGEGITGKVSQFQIGVTLGYKH